jgi:predicted transposase YbfD/YdcC
LAPNAELAAKSVQTHWSIENSLHWVLDLAFREDDLRVRVGNAPENLALIRKLTHNLLQQENNCPEMTARPATLHLEEPK